MTQEAQAIVARRRLRRRLSLWRAGAIIAGAVAVLALMFGSDSGLLKYYDHVARVKVEGFISGDEPTLKLFTDLADDDRVRAVVMHVDSPGGTTVGAEALYEAVRKVAAKKPVVAVMGTVAASGGYATAVAADHVVARGNTITGSIGVIFQWPDVSRLMDTIGIKMEELKSGELKAEPTPFKPASEKVRQVSLAMVADAFDWFTALVAERRKLPLDQVRLLADGRVYTGRQALSAKLIDAIGGEDVALEWLAVSRSIPADLEIIDWKTDDSLGPSDFGLESARALLNALGLGGFVHGLDQALAAGRTRLDGLLSVWHPDSR
jgi:protease-4